MRRIVTGHKNGKSVIVDDTVIPSAEIPALEVVGGLKAAHIWKTYGTPTVPLAEGDLKKNLQFKFHEPGGIRVGIAWLPPDEEIFIKAKEQNLDLDEYWREKNDDDWGMHASDSVDINLILSGDLWLELDDGAEIHLK